MEWVDVGRVADGDLIDRLRRLVRADHALSARLLVHLGEVDARGLYREYAYASMFAYCVDELHMSEAQAYLRIQAARLGRQFPLIVELFAKGLLHLSAIKLLGPHLTPDNYVQVLERASGKGKREIELLVAELAPKPDVPSRMRKLPEASPVRATQAAALAAPTHHAAHALSSFEAPVATRPGDVSHAPLAMEMPSVAAPVSASRATFALEVPRARASSTPLRPGRFKLELTAGQALHDKLEQLKNLLRHQVPDGDLAIIVERAVDLLLDKTVKQRFAQTRAPRKPRAIKRSRKANSRYIPRAVIREVYERDSGQCTYVSRDGKRCCERGFLEFHHHDVPYGRGGKATIDNLRLACRAHNALFAERDFGTGYMLHARARAHGRSRAASGSGAAELCPERVQV
jgi:5-methylcytosine-specific restriction endonuclease McrA